MRIKVETLYRNKLVWEGEIDPQGNIQSSKLSATGTLEFLRAAAALREKFLGNLALVNLPLGRDENSLLIKELLLRIKAQWNPLFEPQELCRCRNVSTRTVEEAVIYGAHSVQTVASRTGAGTSCTTCRPDIQKVLDSYLETSSS